MRLSDWEQRKLDEASQSMVPDIDYTKVPRIYRVTCLEPDSSAKHGVCYASVIVSVNGVETGQTKCPRHGGEAVDISNAGPAERPETMEEHARRVIK